MNIPVKLQEKEAQFDQLQGYLKERQAKIKEIQDEANKQIAALNTEAEQITDEMKRTQGEYRLLVELGKEAGVLDAEGKPVLVEAAEEAQTTVSP